MGVQPLNQPLRSNLSYPDLKAKNKLLKLHGIGLKIGEKYDESGHLAAPLLTLDFDI